MSDSSEIYLKISLDQSFIHTHIQSIQHIHVLQCQHWLIHLYSHHWVPPGQGPGTHDALDSVLHWRVSDVPVQKMFPITFFFSSSMPTPYPRLPLKHTHYSLQYSAQFCPQTHCTLASLPIWSSDRLLLVRPGVVVGSPPSPSTPGQTFRSCIPCRNILNLGKGWFKFDIEIPKTTHMHSSQHKY